MKIPFNNLDYATQPLADDLKSFFTSFLDSGRYVLGPQVESFEAAFARYTQSVFCVGVASGLDALTLALKVLGVGPGDEVIVPSHTYIATWIAISNVGAKIVPVEVDPVSRNLDPLLVEAAITRKTKAILPVHLYGLSAEMQPLRALADEYELFILADAAQAHGNLYHGESICHYADLTAFSFYPTKNLGALGDAGAIVFNDERYLAKLKALRNYGSQKRYYNEVIGYNSRLDEIQAGILNLKLPHLEAWNQRRQEIATLYNTLLSECTHITLPITPPYSNHTWHLYVIETENRDELAAFLLTHGVETLIHYPLPPHLQDAYTRLGFQKGDFPIAERLAAQILSLPCHPGLTNDEIQYICKMITLWNTQAHQHATVRNRQSSV